MAKAARGQQEDEGLGEERRGSMIGVYPESVMRKGWYE